MDEIRLDNINNAEAGPKVNVWNRCKQESERGVGAWGWCMGLVLLMHVIRGWAKYLHAMATFAAAWIRVCCQ